MPSPSTVARVFAEGNGIGAHDVSVRKSNTNRSNGIAANAVRCAIVTRPTNAYQEHVRIRLVL